MYKITVCTVFLSSQYSLTCVFLGPNAFKLDFTENTVTNIMIGRRHTVI